MCLSEHIALRVCDDLLQGRHAVSDRPQDPQPPSEQQTAIGQNANRHDSVSRGSGSGQRSALLSLEEALEAVDRSVAGWRMPSETVPVRHAGGRILASDEKSQLDLPPFDNAAVDGYAVRADDEHAAYILADTTTAGEREGAALAPGHVVKVMTGAPIPRGTARVVMVEHAFEQDGRVQFRDAPAATNIRRRGENVAQGKTILPAGSRLGPLEMACLIGCGVSEVEVTRRVRLAIISTGHEIVDSVAELRPGRIINTNGPLISELARERGLELFSAVRVPDELSAIVAALQHARREADIVVLTGGVSVGDFDLVPEAMVACGLQIQFSRLALKPGKPTTFATGDGALVFGLPGNPVAAYLTFDLFVLRAAARLSGSTGARERSRFRLTTGFSRESGDRTEFVPCRISRDGWAATVAYRGSADLTALLHADGFLVIPRGTTSLSAGAELEVVQFCQEWI